MPMPNIRRKSNIVPSFALGLPLPPPQRSASLEEQLSALREEQVLQNFDTMNEIIPGLFLGQAPSNEDIQRFRITAILNVASDILREDFPGVLDYSHVPLDDHSDEPIARHFDECNKFIGHHLESGGRVLVHCRMGVSRSATIVIAYLMASGFISYRKAFDHVKERRIKVSPNLGFILALRKYQETLGGGRFVSEE
jgi:protein-tyrosine phosphatase